MKRILFNVPRWSVFLHREARGIPQAETWDPPERRFEDELFERLYAGEPELLPERSMERSLRAWAERVHEAATALPDFTRLVAECRGDADAAGLAVETLADQLWPQLKSSPPEDGIPPELRRALRSGCSAASSKVEELRDASEGMEGVGFGPRPGSSSTGSGASSSGGAARSLARRLKDDQRLRQISLLAGRFKRIAARKRREKVRHGADEVADVELGGDLGRLLPAELAKLASPRLRLALLRDLSEKRAMQYRLTGAEPKGKGPVVVCLDKSGSMAGPPDIWATAVALALLDLAQRDHRPFALLCFDGGVRYEALVRPGDKLPEQALFVMPSGGTDIGRCIARGLQVIQENPGQLPKADLVLVTDGQSDTGTAVALRAVARQFGVTLLGMGIGVGPEALGPWCDAAFAVSDLTRLTETEAEALFAA